jgi:hypothetical protein
VAGDRHGHRPRIGLPQSRRALDIGQHERHRPGWEVERVLPDARRTYRLFPPDERPAPLTVRR